LGAQKSSNSK